MRYAYVKNGDAVEQVRRILSKESLPGGPEAFLADFLAAHADDEVLILCVTNRRETLVAGRLRVESYPKGQSKPAQAYRLLVNPLRVALRILSCKPDRMVCGASKQLLWMSVLAARIGGVPAVCARHAGVTDRRGLRRVVDLLTRSAIRSCVGVAAHGPFLRSQVLAMGIPANRVFEFDVDLGAFSSRQGPVPLALQAFKARFPFLIMFLGRIQSGKGVIDLLEAFAGLPHNPALPVGLVYVGEGRDSAQLEACIRDRALGERVLLLGKVAHESIAAVFRCASLVAAPTKPPLIEGRCMVALESLAVGVPVVAPDYAAFPFVVEDGVNGMLFKVGDIGAMRAILSRIVQDELLRERLRQGAATASKQLLTVQRGFASAVDLAFASGRSMP